MENQNENENIIELLDETGESIYFELLDEIEYENNTYLAICPLAEEDTAVQKSDVYILKKIVNENGEDSLEPLEDEALIAKIFKIFKDKNGDKFEYEN